MKQAIPERIISAAPSNTEIITGLGLAGKLIATDKYSKDIAGLDKKLPNVDFFYPDTEAIIAMAPDIIVANEINSFGDANSPYKLLGDAGITVLQIPTAKSLEDIYGDITLIAEKLGVPEKGAHMVKVMRNETTAIVKKAQARENRAGYVKPRVYFELSPAPEMASFGSGSYLNEMIELAGGVNIFAAEKSWFMASAESVIQANPDIIFVVSAAHSDPAKKLESRPGFHVITAVKNKRVYVIDDDSASRPSQNVMKAFREIADAIDRF
jgi:iron complex transport system substrate-binding protein